MGMSDSCFTPVLGSDLRDVLVASLSYKHCSISSKIKHLASLTTL